MYYTMTNHPALTPAQEIREQREHILDGRCKWVPGLPSRAADDSQACLVDRSVAVGERRMEARLSAEAMWYVARAIAEMHPQYWMRVGVYEPSAWSELSADDERSCWGPYDFWGPYDLLYTFCTGWNDEQPRRLVDESVRTEAEVLAVLERAEKLAFMDGEMLNAR